MYIMSEGVLRYRCIRVSVYILYYIGWANFTHVSPTHSLYNIPIFREIYLILTWITGFFVFVLFVFL